MEKLHARLRLLLEINLREETDAEGGQENEDSPGLAEGGNRDQPVEVGPVENIVHVRIQALVADGAEQGDEDGGLAEDGDARDAVVVLFVEHQLEHEQQQRDKAEHDLGPEHEPLVRVGNGLVNDGIHHGEAAGVARVAGAAGAGVAAAKFSESG
jgi:hypothetical protein